MEQACSTKWGEKYIQNVGRNSRKTETLVVNLRADLRIILKCIFTGALAGVKRPGRDADHPPCIIQRLKKE
jgi:hypothetical protein